MAKKKSVKKAATKKTTKKKNAEDLPAFSPLGTTVASDEHWDSSVIQTCIPPLDHILGGGFGCRRLAEIYGPPSCGKSAIGYCMAALVQKQNGIAMISDNEGGFTRSFYEQLGGDADMLHIADEFDTASVEDVFEWIKNNCEVYASYGLDAPPLFILWDSIAATGTMTLQAAEPGKKDLSKSTAMSSGLQKVLPFIRASNVCLLGINQTYKVIGSRVNATTTPGGDRFKFLSSQRLAMNFFDGDMIYDDPKAKRYEANHIGQKVTAKVEKSRFGNPQQRAALYFYTASGAKHPVFDRDTKLGFDIEESLFDYYVNGYFFLDEEKKSRPIKQNDSWYVLHDSIDPSGKSFRKADWLEKLEQFPQLKTLLYHDLDIDTDKLVMQI